MAKIPKLQTISFFGTCPANSNITLVSNFIDVPFNTKKIRASFAPGVERLMTLKYFISGDKNAPTTEEPQGINILAQIGQSLFITGDDEFKEFEHETIHQVAGGYLKVYAKNSDVFDHTIDSQVTIEFIQEDDNA